MKNIYSADSVYSTDEIVIGKWIDGKPIYRKVISFNLGETVQNIAGMKTIDNIPNLSAIINVKGYIRWTKSDNKGGTISIPYTHAEGEGIDQIFDVYNNLNGDIVLGYLLKTTAFDNHDAQIVIEYIKK